MLFRSRVIPVKPDNKAKRAIKVIKATREKQVRPVRTEKTVQRLS